ncbi:MAG: hypothetical protein EXS67_05935 [Candidatus Margulisbacteria bacterium]|nr:hypothetical protein [Candidatus Margulisiibacteriota bacterium]
MAGQVSRAGAPLLRPAFSRNNVFTNTLEKQGWVAAPLKKFFVAAAIDAGELQKELDAFPFVKPRLGLQGLFVRECRYRLSGVPVIDSRSVAISLEAIKDYANLLKWISNAPFLMPSSASPDEAYGMVLIKYTEGPVRLPLHSDENFSHIVMGAINSGPNKGLNRVFTRHPFHIDCSYNSFYNQKSPLVVSTDGNLLGLKQASTVHDLFFPGNIGIKTERYVVIVGRGELIEP